MAPETADDTSKPDDDWLLLCDVRTLVAQYCKSPCSAERLIMEYARKGHFKSYRFHDSTGPTERGGPGISPTSWGAAYPKLGVCVAVDFANSTVTWMRGEPGSYAFALLIDEQSEEFLPSPLTIKYSWYACSMPTCFRCYARSDCCQQRSPAPQRTSRSWSRRNGSMRSTRPILDC